MQKWRFFFNQLSIVHDKKHRGKNEAIRFVPFSNFGKFFLLRTTLGPKRMGLTRDSESHLATQHMASSIWRDIYSDFLLWRELNGDRNT